MANSVEKICDECEVSREEALFYLEGFKWNLDAAIEACHNKTLPDLSVRVPTEIALPAPTPIRTVKQSAEEEHKKKQECIDYFNVVAPGASPQEIMQFLEEADWDADKAVGKFLDYRSRGRSVGGSSSSVSHRPANRGTNLQIGSKAVISDVMHGNAPPLPSLPSQTEFQASVGYSNEKLFTEVKLTNPNSTAMDVDRTETIKEAVIPAYISPLLASQGQGGALPHRDEWIDLIIGETEVTTQEALFYLEGFKWDFYQALKACHNQTLPAVKNATTYQEVPVREEEKLQDLQVQQSDTEKVVSFLQAFPQVTDSRPVFDCLKHYGGDLEEVFNYFLNNGCRLPKFERQFKAQPLGPGTDIRSSSSQAYQTDTGNVTVAVPGTTTSSSQLGGYVADEEDPYDEEADSSMMDDDDPYGDQDRMLVGARATEETAMLTIILANVSGTSVDLRFSLDQTVSDIRDAIEDYTQDDNPNYYLVGRIGGDEYADFNITVRTIVSRNTELAQILKL